LMQNIRLPVSEAECEALFEELQVKDPRFGPSERCNYNPLIKSWHLGKDDMGDSFFAREGEYEWETSSAEVLFP